MKRWLWRGLKTTVVLVGVIVLTSFTIDATDALNGSQSALSIFAKKVAETTCPAGMVEVSMADGNICVDQYENSFAASCPVQLPQSVIETQQNINASDCTTESKAGEIPAIFVTFHQAQTLCARRGGRLPSSYEWYDAALATPDDVSSCNLNGKLSPTGGRPDCRSARGAYDMIGNAWEWVDAAISNGVYQDMTLPSPGFVTEADRAGVAVRTESTPNELFNKDYFWSKPDGSMVMMRGGFYSSREDGGIYSVHADIEPSFSSGAISFRCVKDL